MVIHSLFQVRVHEKSSKCLLPDRQTVGRTDKINTKSKPKNKLKTKLTGKSQTNRICKQKAKRKQTKSHQNTQHKRNQHKRNQHHHHRSIDRTPTTIFSQQTAVLIYFWRFYSAFARIVGEGGCC